MPEGDTLFRLARELGAILTGRTLDRVAGRAPFLSRLEGGRVISVEALGKHLLIGVSRTGAADDLMLRTHLGLHGDWHEYPRGARWKRPERQASLVLHTAEHSFVCFDAAEVDCFRVDHLDRHPRIRSLGPDLLAPELDLDEVVARFRRRRADCLAHLLLDQSVAAGIGNVYKSEVLFLEGHLPMKDSSRLTDDEARRVYRRRGV